MTEAQEVAAGLPREQALGPALEAEVFPWEVAQEVLAESREVSWKKGPAMRSCAGQGSGGSFLLGS